MSLGYRVLLLSLWSLVLLFGSFSCRKKETGPEPAKTSDLTLSIQHNIGSFPLKTDTILYQNKAGNSYSVTKLEYFLSHAVFHGSSGDIVFDNVDYINPLTPDFKSTKPIKVPFGRYSGLTLYLGLDTSHNKSGILPHTVENENMAWPASMGGGYHFLKLEGRFMDTGGPAGYALHLGRNENLVRIDVDADFDIISGIHDMVLTMDINEWFENPHTYDIPKDGRYIMTSAPAMKKISENGRDVLTFKELK